MTNKKNKKKRNHATWKTTPQTHNYNWRSRSRSKLAPLESFAEQNNGNVPTWPTEPEDNGRREREAEETVLVLNQIRSHARTHANNSKYIAIY